MPVNETATLESELTGDIGVSVDRVIMNSLYPDRFPQKDIEALESLGNSEDPELKAVYRAALSQSRRSAAQQEQLARLHEMVSTPISTLPFIFEPEVTLKAARRLAEELS